MYEAYFGLEKRPFAATPDVSCAYLPDPVQEVLNELLLRVEAGEGIALLTAPAGTGKTLLCRKLADEIAGRLPTIYLPSANFPTRRALFQAILYELGAAYNGLDEQELRLALQSQLKLLAEQGKSLLLILDEAHLLSTRLLEEVRSLSDLSENGRPLLRVLLSGQPALEERLMGPELDAVNQRLACHVYLEPLSKAQSREYVLHRVAWAVGRDELFESDALDLIAHGSNGLPRCINQLCDHSLLLAFVAESHAVTRSLVDDALQDLKQLPLHWNDTLPAASPLDGLRRNSSDVAEAEAALPPDTREFSDAVTEFAAVETAGETFAFEFGADPEEYSLSDQPESSTPAAPAATQSPLEIAPSDQDDPLYQPRTSFPGPLDSFDSIEPAQTIPLTRFSSADSAAAWEPVVEDSSVAGPRETYEAPRSLPPARRGVVPLLDLPAQRFSGFEEERVDDPYARIYAGIPFGRPGNSLTAPQFNPASNLPGPGNDLPEIPRAAGEPPLSAKDFTLPRLPPDQLIERIIPMLDEDIDDIQFQAEVPAQSPRSDHPANIEQPAAIAEQEEAEENIGSDVLDLCLEVQDYFAREAAQQSSLATPLERPEPPTVSEFQAASFEFDVIEPEPEATSPPTTSRFHVDSSHTHSDGVSSSGSVVPRPNYRRIFSALRRKLGR